MKSQISELTAALALLNETVNGGGTASDNTGESTNTGEEETDTK